MPSTKGDNPSNLSPNFLTMSASKSTEEAPVHVIYINGINTPNDKYKQTLPLIEKLLDATDIKGKYTLHGDTYNLSGGKLGISDLLQASKQGALPQNFNDVEGSQFDEKVVKKIKDIDKQEQKKGNCQDDNPRAKFLIIAHSQGNFFAEEIYNQLPNDIKDRSSILSISPFTDFNGINFSKFEYLLRKDDFPSFLKKLPGIAVPKDTSNLPNWPGILPNPSHDLENYLNSNKYPEGSRKDTLVEQAFNMAKNGINKLMKPDSGYYKKNCPQQPNIKITGPKTIEALKNGTFTVSWYNPDKNASAVQITGFGGLTIGGEMVAIPEDKREQGSFQFKARNQDFFGSYDSETTFEASLYTSSSWIWGSSVMASDPDVTVKLLGAGDGIGNIPAQAIPVDDKNGNFWVKWL
jgi:hypothetical protein